jgi:hypothetical protein
VLQIAKNIRNHRTVTRPGSSVWKFRLHSLNSLQKTHRQIRPGKTVV